ncbi:hypothetical protein [Vibrio algivorus]|uniref:Uncharacterized protein n=1 Tax=Vibrio algivorus TaxID=1667024 RepID=A0ABQ6EM32_9VIBR|nr:hypothetical protein [Vibrio algivorus]GLT13587.1 hypothetical protein GCM10007931_05610 [Vibrio algivorus]
MKSLSGIVFDDVSKMTMKIEDKYRDSFTNHIPEHLYPDYILNTQVYNDIAKYDQEFDRKEYQVLLKQKNKQ